MARRIVTPFNMGRIHLPDRVAAGLKTFIKIVQPRTSDCGPERELELNHANPLSNKCWTKPPEHTKVRAFGVNLDEVNV